MPNHLDALQIEFYEHLRYNGKPPTIAYLGRDQLINILANKDIFKYGYTVTRNDKITILNLDIIEVNLKDYLKVY